MCLVLRLFILSLIKFEADEEISILLAALAAVFSAIGMKLMSSPSTVLSSEFINNSFFYGKNFCKSRRKYIYVKQYEYPSVHISSFLAALLRLFS